MVQDIVIENDEDAEAVSESEDEVDEDMTEEDDNVTHKDTDVATKFCNVMMLKSTDSFDRIGNTIIDCMTAMKMKKREKGNIGGEQRFKSLLG